MHKSDILKLIYMDYRFPECQSFINILRSDLDVLQSHCYDSLVVWINIKLYMSVKGSETKVFVNSQPEIDRISALLLKSYLWDSLKNKNTAYRFG